MPQLNLIISWKGEDENDLNMGSGIIYNVDYQISGRFKPTASFKVPFHFKTPFLVLCNVPKMLHVDYQISNPNRTF